MPSWDLVEELTAQIQPRKQVLDRADYTSPTRQHELKHTDHTDQEYIYLPCKILLL